MEMEQKTSTTPTKKLWKFVRIVFYMLKSSKIFVDLNLIAKKGSKLAGKAIDNISMINAVNNIMDILNNEVVVESSPVVVLPGFGKSPTVVRQLRITDSPFPLKDDMSDLTVDKKAEEFIERFYSDLKLQKSRGTFDQSPDQYMWGR
ncbi:hypothetical protein ACFE04_014414 [Oxalis oulophora]